MALPVIANVFRVTFNVQASEQLAMHNVLHFASSAVANEIELGTMIDAALDANYEQMFATMPTNYGVNNIDVLPLDGTSSTVNVALSNHGGQADGESIPGSACIVKLGTGERGRSRRGRIFLGPVAESAQLNGFLVAGLRSEVENGWRAFQDDLIAGSSTVALQVTSYVAGGSTRLCTAITVPVVMGTQRRRQSRLQPQ
jgi:hypothetical protein